MIISEKQLICLIDILKDSFGIQNQDAPFAISLEQRVDLYKMIINQQSEELRKINPNSNLADLHQNE